MKKIILSCIMIISTFCTIYIVAFWEPEIKPKNQELVINNNDKNNNDKNINKDSNSDNKKSEIKNEENKTKEKKENKEVSNNNSQKTVSNMALLKMSQEEILDSLSISDKIKLGKYAYKMQEVDRNRILQWMSGENKIEGAKKSYELVKKRLSTEDFNELQGIIAPFVNMDLLKQHI